MIGNAFADDGVNHTLAPVDGKKFGMYYSEPQV